MLIFQIVFNYHQDIIEIIIELNDTNICVKRNFMNSLGDNKRLFFYIFYFFFFFCLFINHYLRHVLAGLGSSGKRISSRLDAITAEKERKEERQSGSMEI